MLKQDSKIHFIAIGGSVMANLAYALKTKGMQVSGSDDDIFEPTKSLLSKNNLLPQQFGWFPERVTEEIDAVVLGMHAKKDNPELVKAQSLGIKIYSFPEFVYELSKDKQRIVIAGSHGKTTITAMIMHVLKFHNKNFDYVVGAAVEGFEATVKLSNAPIIIIEGDEYPCSALDLTPKFLKYHHHIGLISGVQWDHVNIYPDIDDYVKQFELFADNSPKAGNLVYNESDAMAQVICAKERADVNRLEYKEHKHKVRDGKTYLITDGGEVEVSFFGKHNMENFSGAKTVLKRLGLVSSQIYEAIASFKGASRRLEKICEIDGKVAFKDFAHAPSKVEATIQAVKEIYPQSKLTAILELHTFSSLTKSFHKQFQNTMDVADFPIVYFNPEKIALKRLETFSPSEVKEAFGNKNLVCFDRLDELQSYLEQLNWENNNLLWMSSGHFEGLDFETLSKKLLA